MAWLKFKNAFHTDRLHLLLLLLLLIVGLLLMLFTSGISSFLPPSHVVAEYESFDSRWRNPQFPEL
jgi:hypothetical protein